MPLSVGNSSAHSKQHCVIKRWLICYNAAKGTKNTQNPLGIHKAFAQLQAIKGEYRKTSDSNEG